MCVGGEGTPSARRLRPSVRLHANHVLQVKQKSPIIVKDALEVPPPAKLNHHHQLEVEEHEKSLGAILWSLLLLIVDKKTDMIRAHLCLQFGAVRAQG